MLVLVHDVQWYGLGDDVIRLGRGDQQVDAVAAVGFVAGLGGPAVDGDGAVLDEPLDQRAGQPRESSVQVLIEPAPGEPAPDVEGDPARVRAVHVRSAPGQVLVQKDVILRRFLGHHQAMISERPTA